MRRPENDHGSRPSVQRGADRPASRFGDRPERASSFGGSRDDRGGRDDARVSRPPQPERQPAPEIPEDVLFSDLDRPVRARLRTLSKENAENVGLHLVMAGRLLDTEPELAYEHAQAAVQRAGRVDVVREAAGLAAYRTGRFAEALRELRTVRRLNGSSEHLAIMADCERGLGRPERALALADSPEASDLPVDVRVELAIVVSGARLDLGEAEAAVAVLSVPVVRTVTGILAARVAQARATALEAAGRSVEAATELAAFTSDQLAQAAGDVEDEEDEVVVFDLADEPADGGGGAGVGTDDGSTLAGSTRVEPAVRDAGSVATSATDGDE
jgi:hypothetical protein